MPRSQWQRIALARAFMRAHQPEVHFLLFDEPVRLVVCFPTSNLTDSAAKS
jgi:ABC-type arginine transport system ATPase subunit